MAFSLAYRHFYLARCLYHILVLLSLFIFIYYCIDQEKAEAGRHCSSRVLDRHHSDTVL